MAASKARLKRAEVALATRPKAEAVAAADRARRFAVWVKTLSRAELRAEIAKRRAALGITPEQADPFLRWIPEDLRPALVALEDAERLAVRTSGWRRGPFARWAPSPSADFRFPRALVEFVLHPPHEFSLGHNCERCGLSVPICMSRDGKTGPQPDPFPFATCPACGGKTSYTAFWQTGPKIDSVSEAIPD